MSIDGSFPGNRFIGAHWSTGAEPTALARLRTLTAGWARAEGPGWLVASEQEASIVEAEGVTLALSLDRVPLCEPPRLWPIAELVRELARTGPALFSSAAAPFRAVWRDADGVHAWTDPYGLGQIFTGSAEGLAVVASSATLLADVLNAPISPESLAGYATFGTFIAQETPFAGISKLGAGRQVSLRQGRVATSAYSRTSRQPLPLTEAFLAAVETLLVVAPDAELELSGGLDSRLILAAMPPAARRGRRAITIGVETEPSKDVTVARDLAAREGLVWSMLDVGGVAALSADELSGLLRRAVVGYDHMANPVDKVALIVAGRERAVDARFGGQNGEILRGFYYPGQPLDATPSEALAQRLIDWRLTTNDGVGAGALSASYAGEFRMAARQRMTTLLMSFGGTWGQTLDRFYLEQRMQNWVGNSAGNRLMSHVPLYPFFDVRVVEAAMALPPREKLNSAVAYRLLRDIDDNLARLPLADGVVPAKVPTTPLGHTINNIWMDAGKVTARLGRMLRRSRRPTLGSQTLTQTWHSLGLYRSLPFDRLTRSGVFDERYLEDVSHGAAIPDRATLGLLELVASLTESR